MSTVERRGKRAVLLLIALGFAWMAVSLWITRDTDPYLPNLWPPIIAVVAVACGLLAFFPRARLYRWAGALAVVGILSRIIAVILTMIAQTSPLSPWRYSIALVVYAMAAYGMHTVWRYEIGPWVESERQREAT